MQHNLPDEYKYLLVNYILQSKPGKDMQIS